MIIRYHNEDVDVELPKRNVKRLLKHLEIIPNTVVVLKNGNIVDMNAGFREDDKMEIVKVMSGG